MSDLQIEELPADRRTVEADQRTTLDRSTIFYQRTIFADRRTMFDLQIEELIADQRTIEADRRSIFNRRTIFD